MFKSFRKIKYNFEGYSVPPPLSEQAKSILLNKGEDAFKKSYGDYYVLGMVRGASMELSVNV